MKDIPQLEIPDAVREMAERNVEQAKQAYNQFLDMARQAQGMFTMSSGFMPPGAMEIQAKSLAFTQQNIEASFACAAELARARDLKEYLEIQTRHAQRQMQTYTAQAQELGRMMSEAAQKAQPR